ncbi:unnamed protein product [Phyllotreta striolata]|uniref:BED-type domain-containing protein n=1 Tax=Phyllotreta striolata TaxID=444603 RepID=A0A9P0DX03_PHYSR|nr:unnamed protein product [Phyllotreta striolata]CAH1188808.1 unnamed protein product [Phyllotreta striolata]
MAPKSFIWKFFTKLSQETARCNICSKTLKTSGNTSNLHSHLKQKHDTVFKQLDQSTDAADASKRRKMSSIEQQVPKDKERAISPVSSERSDSINTVTEGPEGSVANFEASCSSSDPSTSSKCAETVLKLKQSRQPSITQAIRQVSSFSEGGSKNTKITEAIVNFIVQDNLPFSTVERKGFLNLMKEVAPLYKVPTRNCIKDRIDKKFEVLSETFKRLIESVKYFTITTDIWTADMQTKSFMGVTLHFIKNLKMCSATLGVTELTEAHTSAYIVTQLETNLNEWNIGTDRLVAAVTDNGANMVKACQDFLGKSKHVPCFAHTINLVCEQALKNTQNLDKLIEKVRTIVVWFKRSVHASDELRRIQQNRGTPEGNMLKMILDVKTRWNSTYYMLERFLKLAPLIGNIILSNVNAPNMVNASDLEELKQVCQLLVPLEQTTKEMSGQNYITLSKVIPMIMCLVTQYEHFNTSVGLAENLKSAILKELYRRFGSAEKCFLLAASTILDPRFKNIHFKDPLALSSIIRHLKSEMNSIGGEESSSSSDISPQVEKPEPVFDLWAPHKNIAYTKKTKRRGEKFDEFTQYLSIPVRNLKDNPLEIWEEMKLVYPNLFKLAQKYLGILATSVPSERLFSKAGAIATKNRSRLTGKRLSKLLFLESFSEM